ncbi:hypothetical protein [Hypericibacter sp.]
MRSDFRTAQKKAARFLPDRMDLVKRFMPDDAATIEQDINRIPSGK